MSRVLRPCLAAALACLLAPLGMAQTITGAITGTVTDASGGIVPNVRVIAANTGTNLTYPTQTNESGVYNLLFLPVGNYTVSVESAGFKKSVLGPFKLETAQVARVDVKLEVGEVTQSVQITDVAPILQTETTQTGDVIAGTQATALPINSRNVVQLTLLIPGVVTPNPAGMVTFRGGARPYVNGNREQTNNFLLDGMDVNESVGNTVSYNPNVDALEEVKISTGNAPAEFGNANGAIVNMTTKSGTNLMHGNVFEFLRNEKFDANSFFNNRSNAKKRALRQNIFGGTLGGPIKKDKAFFFIDYQGARQIDSGPALRSVALADYRAGNLSRFAARIKDPTLTGVCSTTVNTACFPGNIIPQSRIVNPVARALFSDPQLYPLPNQAGTGAIGVTNNYLSTSRNTINSDQGDVKLDYRLTEKDNLSGRLTIARYNSVTGSAVAFQMGSRSVQPTTGTVINWTRTFSASIVNEARIGYHRTVSTAATTDPFGVLGSGGNAKLGIAGGQPIAGASSITLGNGMTNIGAGASDSSTASNNFQYGDNLTSQRGRHTLKMGVQFLRYQQNRFYAGNNGLLGIFTFSGVYTSDVTADFLLNLLNSKGRGSQTGKWGHRQWRDGVFFQDDFKVRPNLTLNLGLRWEYTQPTYEVKDRQANFDLQTGRQQLAGKDGNSRALYKPYYKQFMPRIGVAWTPGMFHTKLVARAGYGITSFMEGTGANLRLPLNPPFFFESNIAFDQTTPGDIRTGFSDVVPLNTASGQVRAWDPSLRPAFIQQWNFSLEYQLTSATSFNAAYVGQKGTHVVDPREFNQPLPGAGPVASWAPLQTRRPLYSAAPLITTISGTDSSSTMFYNALQLSSRRRFNRGLEFLASYTLSKTLTDNLGYYGSAGVAGEGAYWQNAYDRRGDWGRAFFDAKHVFSLGGSYNLPVGKDRSLGRSWGRALDMILGGWAANYTVSLHSGFPITLTSTGQAGGQLARGSLRPNRYGPRLSYSDQTIDRWFGTGNSFCLSAGVNDGACPYGVPATEAFGNTAKGTERAPAFRNLDFGLGKKFNISERKYFDFRAEFFNFLNHPNFSPPAVNIAAPATFGFITGQIGNPRNIEFGLKFYF